MGIGRAFALAMMLLLPGTVQAEPVDLQVTALVPEGSERLPVSWSAVPLDLPEGADVLAAMTISPVALEGPWQVVLEPGAYVISGFTDAELYEISIDVTAQTRRIEVPVLEIAPQVVVRCAERLCTHVDAATGLRLTLPKGWSMDAPHFADPGGGQRADAVSAVFFEDIGGDGGAVWFLNPSDWINGESGPCRAVAVGDLCTFDLSPEAEAAFAVIAPSLQLEGRPAPQDQAPAP